PVQVKILPLVDKHYDYAYEVKKLLELNDIRVEIDARNEKIGYKIREAQMEKIPYMLVIGDKEMDSKAVSVRSRKDGDIGTMSAQDFVDKLLQEIKNKAN
ncbi:MAG: His/Gly/Thr/Pro-type tRNA ligase C-terminal domain-containing protein, partial [Ruminiclostridium sp.]